MADMNRGNYLYKFPALIISFLMAVSLMTGAFPSVTQTAVGQEEVLTDSDNITLDSGNGTQDVIVLSPDEENTTPDTGNGTLDTDIFPPEYSADIYDITPPENLPPKGNPKLDSVPRESLSGKNYSGNTSPSSSNTSRILVKYISDNISRSIAEMYSTFFSDKIETIPNLGVQILEVETGQVDSILESLKNNPDILYAEPDYEISVVPVPGDTYITSQWGLDKIFAPDSWNVTHGSPSVKIAILDSGIDRDHEDLASKIVTNVNFSDANSVDDFFGHGTWTAGIAAAIADNGLGITGVGYNASLTNVKVLNDIGSATISTISDGIIWAADNGANVISMSLGGTDYSQTLKDAVDYAWSKWAVIAAAAGNNGNSVPCYPANFSNCIAVTATGENDDLASFSNYGSWVDVAAPGVDIYATLPNHDNYFGWHSYGSLSGTSAACPFVSGLAALVWSTSFGTSNSAVRTEIENTCDPITGTGSCFVYGRINAYYAVAGAGAPPPEGGGYTVNSPPVLSLTGDRVVSRNMLLTLTITSNDADGDNLTFSASLFNKMNTCKTRRKS